MRRLLLLLIGAFVLAGPARGDVLVRDDFSDGDFTANPAWVVDSGTFKVEGGALAFGTEPDAAIHLDLGSVAPRRPVKVVFTLWQTDGTGGSYLFTIGLEDTACGRGYPIHCSPNVGYFGGGDNNTGFYDGTTNGVPGSCLNPNTAAQQIELLFDPVGDKLTLSKDGAVVFGAANYQQMPRVDRLSLKTSGTVRWFIDDVTVDATLRDPAAEAQPGYAAKQMIYRTGVPHTDGHGQPLMEYDPARSFFQIGIWGNPIGEIWGTNYDLKTLTDAGFNTMWPWPSSTLEDSLEVGKQAGLQVVQMNAIEDAVLEKVKDHPNLLGTCWMDEPTGALWGKDMDAKFAEFLAYKEKANRIAPDLRVFVNDVPWITPPATEWWTKWNTAGDVSCHDNYPIKHTAQTQTISAIADTVSLAASANQEKRPVWLIVGAFEQPGQGAFPFRFPTPMQLRACVYAAIIHGATGIVYFTWDTYVCRDGNVIGMSPDPKVAYVPSPREPGYTHPTPATPAQLVQSRALWGMATQLNQELRELVPSLLSPTVGPDELDYSVAATLGRTDHPVHCLLKPHPGGGHVLLTVNLDDTVINTTFQFSKPLRSVEPLFENQLPLAVEPGTTEFDAVYEPFEVHVYRVQ